MQTTVESITSLQGKGDQAAPEAEANDDDEFTKAFKVGTLVWRELSAGRPSTT
jgi:hypothetical protein